MAVTVLEERKGDPPQTRLDAIRGDTFTYFRQFQDVNGNPRDISDSDFWFEIRVSLNQNTGDPLVKATNITKHQSQAAIDYDVAQGNPAGTTYDQVLIVISPTDMDIIAGSWRWGFRETEADGTRTSREQGTIKMKENAAVNT